MVGRIILYVSFLIILGSCRKEKADETETVPHSVNAEAVDVPAEKTFKEQCFMKVNGKDTIRLAFVKQGDSIHGKYDNLHYGMDKRRSTFTGILNDNKATTISKYSAEGQDYIEELNFVIDGNNAKLDYGPTEQTKNGVWRYKMGVDLSQHVLPKADCKD